jgi:hypothetical protein
MQETYNEIVAYIEHIRISGTKIYFMNFNT